MKIKILLMPVSVIIALVLIIWHIYPAWFGAEANSIKTMRTELKNKETSVMDIKNRKSNIKKLTDALSSSTEKKDLINRYYPTYRNEEDIINNINTVAFTEGVFLSDMAVEYKDIKVEDDSNVLMALPKQENKPLVISTIMSVDGSGLVVDPLVAAEAPVELEMNMSTRVKYVEVGLGASGNYDQLKKFMTSLNTLGLLNNIQSFKVYKDTEEGADSAEDKKVDDAGNILKVDLLINFGYLKAKNEPVLSLLNNDLFINGEFAFKPMEEKRDIISGNYTMSEIGETGMVNPFLEAAVAPEEE